MISKSFRTTFLLIAFITASSAIGQEHKTAERLLNEFSDQWDESAWVGGKRAYIRSLESDDWQVRMRTLQGLSQLGADAKAAVVDTVAHGETPQRIFAAQALGYLGADVSLTRLLELIRKEKEAAVRLYLIASIGQLGCGEEAKDALKELQKTESNSDVKQHIGYVLERSAKPIDPSELQTLRGFDASTMETASIGKPAPDFRLTSVHGDEIQLSQYRGKKPVVLVFIYGDT